MRIIARSFVNGLIVLVPIVVTGYVVYALVTFVDGALGVPVPGLGILLVLVAILLVGAVVSNVVGQRVLGAVEALIDRLPIVKLLYGSIKDLMGAFVGDKKSFDRPVLVELVPGTGIKVLGFRTSEHFDDPGLAGHVSVYLPQSYNFAGNLIVVPRDRVHPVDADGAQFLAFIMSGGVTSMSAAQTMLDADVFPLRRSARR